jgi:hypothetical protein
MLCTAAKAEKGVRSMIVVKKNDLEIRIGNYTIALLAIMIKILFL